MVNTERSKGRDIAESLAVVFVLFVLMKLLIRLTIGLTVTAYWLIALVVWSGFVLILSINRPMTIALRDVDAKFKMAKVTTALVASWTY